MRKTKVIATLSGATEYGTFLTMAKNLDCVRINLSHGSLPAYRAIVGHARRAGAELGKYIPVLFDLAGPKIRVAGISGAVEVRRGREIALSRRATGQIPCFGLNYPKILDQLESGDRVFVNDGKVRFKVTGTIPGGRVLTALTDGVVEERKGVNFPDTELPLPSLTAKDIADIGTIASLGGDYVALSFVRRPEDIHTLRRRLKARGLSIPVIAKIERPEVIRVLDSVVEVSDGVMVARGDLGVELSLEKVPVCQKRTIGICREKGKPVIVATQILETMIEKPEPTRAEVSDIANAIFDGCDALMLSGETAYGRYPVEALRMLDTVALETERHLRSFRPADAASFPFLRGDTTSAIAFAAYNTAESLGARAIVCFTASGQTASILSKFRSTRPVIAASYREETLRRAALYFGVRPLRVREGKSADQLLYEMERALLGAGFRRGDLVVMTIGLPVAERGTTNMIKVHALGGYLPYRELHLPKQRRHV